MRTVLAATLLAASAVAAGDGNRESAEFLLRRALAFHGPRLVATPGAAANARLRALRAIRRMEAMPDQQRQGTWRLLGPRPTIVLTDATSGGPPMASGRVNAVAVHPANGNVAYLGAANGGVWKTIDSGQNWTPLTDDQDSLAIGSLAIDPSNPETVYAGTGEENFSSDSYFGAGILKTVDGGRTWKTIASTAFGGLTSATAGGAHIGSLAVQPRNSRILLAGVEGTRVEHSGIYRSIDAGETWRLVLPGAPGTSVVFNPANPNISYAGLGSRNKAKANGIYKSIDGGQHWTRAMRGITGSADAGDAETKVDPVGRVSIAIAASKPDTLYASIANTDTNDTLGVFKTTDGGATWADANTPSYCSPICWYANSIQVSQENPDVVLVGGTVLYMTRDGGKTPWIQVTEGANGIFIHWDVHALAFGPAGRRLYIGTDGGMFRGDNVGSSRIRDVGWTNINNTLALTQFYPGCSANPETTDFMICGTQDNGTQMYTGGGSWWNMIAGGDGGYTAVDTARPAVFYYSAAGFVSVSKSSPFTLYKGFLEVTTGIDSVNTNDCFVPPLVLDPANPQHLYFACRKVYRSTDGGGVWTAISPQLDAKDGAPAYTFLAVAPSRSDRVYAATNDGRVFVSDNATAPSGAQWVARNAGLPGRAISSVTVDAADPDTAYVTTLGFSGFGDSLGHVFKTTNGGGVWSDISGNLPNIGVNILVPDPLWAGVSYIGADIGVFRTADHGVSWTPVGKQLPRTPVVDLKLNPAARVLRAATHGRGMWEIPLGSPPRATRRVRVESASVSVQLLGIIPQVIATVKGTGFTADAAVRWNGADRATRVVDANTLQATLSLIDLASPGRTSVSVCDRQSGGASNVINFDTHVLPVIFGLANAAGSTDPAQPATVAPGSIVSLYGANLSVDTVTPPLSSAGQTLAGAIVEFKSFVTHLAYPVKLLYVSPSQINFQVPWDVPVDVTLDLDVVQGTRMSTPVSVATGVFSPGLFAVNAKGSGQGWIFCVSDQKLAGPQAAGARPAKPGEDIRILATGLGHFFQEDGPKTRETATLPEVRIAGVRVNLKKSAAMDPFVGMYEVIVTVPNVPSGAAVPISVSVGGLSSNVVTIAVE